jgi:hypothetical protein
MGQEEEEEEEHAVLVPAAAEVFSWEPTVVKARSAAAAVEAGACRDVPPPWSPKKVQVPHHQQPPPAWRLSVPLPPGRASAPAAARSLSSRATVRAVRTEDDPFLATYLACTKSRAAGRTTPARRGGRRPSRGGGGSRGPGSASPVRAPLALWSKAW